jgi:hypothetical protein
VKANSHAVFYRETGNCRKTQILAAKIACFGIRGSEIKLQNWKSSVVEGDPAPNPQPVSNSGSTATNFRYINCQKWRNGSSESSLTPTFDARDNESAFRKVSKN